MEDNYDLHLGIALSKRNNNFVHKVAVNYF